MKALISGQAGLALFIQGNEIVVVTVDDLEKEKKYSLNASYGLLADATDVVSYDSISKLNAIKILDLHWHFDRSLHLILILLDSSELKDLRLEAAECLEDFFQKKDVLNFVANRLYSAVLPSSANIKEAIDISQFKKVLIAFLISLKDNQNIIEKYVASWNALSIELFESLDGKNEFRRELINKGIFRGFVNANQSSELFSNEQMRFLKEFKGWSNYLQVFKIWLKGFKPRLTRQLELIAADDSDYYEDKKNVIHSKLRLNVQEIRERIKKQKEAIVFNMKNGNLERARSYVEQLINMQNECGEPVHITKSLCDLAQEAKNIYNYSFQLELAEKAVSIVPEDGWANGQLADAYFCLHKFNQSLESFKNARYYGEEMFGLTGIARILRAQGKLEKSYDAYDSLKDRFPEQATIWAERAEVLRQMCFLELALEAYSEAMYKFPFERILRCGYAATLVDMGRLEVALTNYEKCIKDLGEDDVPINGSATILRKMGKYQDALKLYDIGIKKFPNSIALIYSRAKVFKEMGNHLKALREFDYICLKYPYEVRAWIGKAEVLKELKKFDEAILVYEQSIEMFPFNQWIRNGRASVYKKQGTYVKALQVYESNLRKDPYDIIALCGKADLLKELGEFEESLKVYDIISSKSPDSKRIQHAKASIFIVLGRYAEATKVISYLKEPKTKDDWIAYHVKGVLSMKINKIDEAMLIFETGLKNSPFMKERQYFANSLAVARLRKKDFKGTITLLSNKNTPLANVLYLHACGEIAKNDNIKMERDKIIQECLQKKCPPYLVPLMVELELRYFSNVSKSQHTDDWVFEQECNSGVLSSV